jgi:predicted MPP superfamily phosphohydrolase
LTARRWLGGLALAIGVASLVLALFEVRDVWVMSRLRATVKLTLYWSAAALLPLGLLATLSVRASWRRRAFARVGAAALGALFAATLLWARYVEPAQLEVVETQVDDACGVRVALVSDLHRGIYWRDGRLDALVERLNALPVDAVLVAGDWTYEPPRDLDAAFAPWARLRHRSIGVLGNHDEQQPGPPLKRELRAALERHGLQWAEGRRLTLGRCELVGLGDLDAGSDRRDLLRLRDVPSTVDGARRVVLAHNPDSSAQLPQGFASVTLSGHTHGGQVDLPGLTPLLLANRTAYGLRRGLYELPHGRVFVTSGLGMSKLPLRLRVPPTIDLLQL